MLHDMPGSSPTDKNTISDTWTHMAAINEGEALDTFVERIQQGTAGCVSDGSGAEGITSAGYKSLHHDDKQPAFQGAQKIPGRADDQTSYRAELAGILLLMMTVNYICMSKHVHTGKITVACDNQSALKSAFQHNHVTSKSKSRDILQAIYLQRRLTSLKWIPMHVRGHQDGKKEILTDWEQANVDCDDLAGHARIDNSLTPDHTPLAGEGWRLRLGTDIITGHIDTALTDHCTKANAIEYWSTRGRFNKNQSHHVNWNALKKATRIIPARRQLFLTKLYSGFHCTAKVMHRRKEWDDATCPLCKQMEDHIHVIQCQSDTAQAYFANSYGTLEEWLEKTTSKKIQEAIWVIIDDYRQSTNEELLYPTWSTSVCTAVTQQRLLGPRSFVEGIHTIAWIPAQQAFYSATNKHHHSAAHWTASLIAKVWTFSHDMWKARCNAIHNNQIQASMSHNTYAVQLQALLRYPPPASMPAHDRKHFIPLEQALTYTYQRQKRLLRLLTTFTTAHAHRINTPSARLMINWLSSIHDH